MRLYIPENKFLNSTGSSNDLHGRNLGHVMLSNMLPGLIAGFPSLAMHVEIIIKEVSLVEPPRSQPLPLITIRGVGRTLPVFNH